MSLSKKNLDKLNKYKKNKFLNNDINIKNNYIKIDNQHNSTELNCLPSSLRQIIIFLLDLRLFILKVFNSLMISSGILFLY